MKRQSFAAAAAARQDFWDKVNVLGECWEWTGATTPWGYGKLTAASKTLLAHRCSYEFAFGPIAKGMFICHRCDNPPCVNPAHLFEGTAADNTRDMLDKGRAGYKGAAGERNPHSRLTEDEVVQIRVQFAEGKPPKELSALFGVTKYAINRIIRGESWPHAGGPICTIDRRGLHRRKAA